MKKYLNAEYKPFLSLPLHAVIPFFFLWGFSGMGIGLRVVRYSQDLLDEAAIELVVILACLLFMHLFDSQYWPKPLQVISWSMVFVSICVLLCALVAIVPYGPICIFTVLVPLSVFGIKNTLFPHVPGHVLVGWNYKVFVSLASIIIVAFFYWCSINGNMWDSETKAEYSQKAGCAVDYTNLEGCENEDEEGLPCFFDEYYEVVTFSEECTPSCLGIYQACGEAFIVWSFPGLASMTLFVMGFISKYLENPGDPYASHHINAVAKFCVVFLFLFWIFASLAGAGEGLSNSLIAFAISMYIGSAMVFSLVFWNSLVAHAIDDDLSAATKVVAPGSDVIIDEVTNQLESYINLVRGLVVLAFSPLILIYLLLSMANQFVRRFITQRFLGTRMSAAEREHKGYFTLNVTSQIDDFYTWDHVEVLSYAVYWGVGYVFLNVLASKFTTVFLSWLIDSTSEMNISIVTIIVLGVGMILFMIPPIPGLPIYLTAGIVLVSVGRELLGLYGSIVYACFVSLFLKLMACAVQQKIIGGYLGNIIAVRQLVAINSEAIRAMRVILSDSGITRRKVAVLVGGPDWPVSVLCGILGFDLFPILIGTLPVIVLIIPTVLCGSFAYMGSIESDDGSDLYPWADTMGAMASAIAAGAMFYFSLSAAGAVKKTLTMEKEAIDAIPLDEAVKEANEEAEKRDISYRHVTMWSSIPAKMKGILISAVLAMIGCCYLLVIFNSQCFQEYDLMYTIQQHLGGQWTNIMLPLGRVSMLLFSVGYGLLLIFESWAKAEADAYIETMIDSRRTPLNII